MRLHVRALFVAITFAVGAGPAASSQVWIDLIRRTSPQHYGQVKTDFTAAAYASLLSVEGLYLVRASNRDGLSGREYLVGIRAGRVELFQSMFWIV